jgi:hypothetical protein
MSHRDEFQGANGGCGVAAFAVVMALIALAILTKGSLW